MRNFLFILLIPVMMGCSSNEPFGPPFPTIYDFEHYPPPYVRLEPERWKEGDSIRLVAVPYFPNKQLYYLSYEFSMDLDSLQLKGPCNCAHELHGKVQFQSNECSEARILYFPLSFHLGTEMNGLVYLKYCRVADSTWEVSHRESYYVLIKYKEGAADTLAKIPLGDDYFNIALPKDWTKMCNTHVTYKMDDPILPNMKSVSKPLPLPKALWLAHAFPERELEILQVFAINSSVDSFSFKQVDSIVHSGNFYENN